MSHCLKLIGNFGIKIANFGRHEHPENLRKEQGKVMIFEFFKQLGDWKY